MTTRLSESAIHSDRPDFDAQRQSFGPESHPPSLADRCIISCYANILQRLASTWRVEAEGLECLDQLVTSKQRHVLAFWHRDYITLFRLFRHRSVVAMTNQSRRGRIIAGICRRSGMHSLQVNGNGTKQLLHSLQQVAEQELGIGIAVDGPLGPPQEVKRVVLRLAAKLKCQIVPVSVATTNKCVMKNRWDRLEIPYPFSRVSFLVGQPRDASSIHPGDEFHEFGLQLQADIERGETLARQRLKV